MVTMAEFTKQVDRLTAEQLAIIVRELAKAPAPVVVDHDFLAYRLATEVLRFFFGNAWTNENVFSMHKDISSQHRSGRKFLKTDSTESQEQFRHQERVKALAEIIFNLQGTEGVRERIALMQKNDLESALGELECASLLALPHLRFRFVTPTGVKRQDYEGEIVTSADRTVYCEMKSKSERTEPNHSTLWRTFDDGRRQLPKGKPGMILVRIPEEWVNRQGIQIVVENAVKKIFRQSQTVVAIVLLWEEWHSTSKNWQLILRRFKPYQNESSPLFGPDTETLLSIMGRAPNPGWVQFQSLVAQTFRS